MRQSEIRMASEETLHEMRQELLSQEEMFGLDVTDEKRLREIDQALEEVGDGVGVATTSHDEFAADWSPARGAEAFEAVEDL